MLEKFYKGIYQIGLLLVLSGSYAFGMYLMEVPKMTAVLVGAGSLGALSFYWDGLLHKLSSDLFWDRGE